MVSPALLDETYTVSLELPKRTVINTFFGQITPFVVPGIPEFEKATRIIPAVVSWFANNSYAAVGEEPDGKAYQVFALAHTVCPLLPGPDNPPLIAAAIVEASGMPCIWLIRQT